jgi:hypothetical protein
VGGGEREKREMVTLEKLEMMTLSSRGKGVGRSKVGLDHRSEVRSKVGLDHRSEVRTSMVQGAMPGL